MKEGERISHPSFGKIVVSRITGRGQRCFGSDLEHDHTIQITINRASYRRELSHDWHSIDNQIIEIRMTPLQWAEFVSSQGQGDGTPVTITHQAGEGRIDPPPNYKQAHHAVFKGEAQERVDRATESAREAERMLKELTGNPGTIKKGDLLEIQQKLTQAIQDMQSNVGFVMESFEKATARVVHDAKEEINAHYSQIVHNYGLKALAAAQGHALPDAPTMSNVLDAEATP